MSVAEQGRINDLEHLLDARGFELVTLRAANKALLGRATNAEIALGREKIVYTELVEMVGGVLDSDKIWLDTWLNLPTRRYNPCEKCLCPVHESEKICEWCEHEQKGTA